jgi:hypothetical protein
MFRVGGYGPYSGGQSLGGNADTCAYSKGDAQA